MLKRIITSIVSICILVPILIFADTAVLPIAVSVITCIALYEMYKCIGAMKYLGIYLPAFLIAAALPFVQRYIIVCFEAVVLASVAIYLINLFTYCLMSGEEFKFADISQIFTVTLYIILAFNAILYVHDLDGIQNGKYIYLLIFVGAWITDIFAYFCGMLFGKHKLIPKVSPKKTVEGSIGGIIFCMIAFVAFGFIIKVIDPSVEINYVILLVSGLLISVVSQIGDLTMSVIKRQYGIKDYGKIFPGHGGVLDRFDSILSVAMLLAAICAYFSSIDIVIIGGMF
ncbi:MAG: phosphatidate cytidylyltransferase [Clostridia bacterium]|nr:phosphatidate cytidylyltransferase [Clostridia bacterium]